MKLLQMGYSRPTVKRVSSFSIQGMRRSKGTEDWDETPCVDPEFAVGAEHCYSQIPGFAFTITLQQSLVLGDPSQTISPAQLSLDTFHGAKSLESLVPEGTFPTSGFKGKLFL